MIPLLSIETSGELCSVAILKSENNYFEINLSEKNIHSEKLMSAIDDLTNLSGLQISDVKAIALSIGPGSFTGLRIGMSTAKGLAFGAGLPIIPVKTYYAHALEISQYLPAETTFVIANNVNTTELFVSKYKTSEKLFDVVEDVKIIKKEEFENFIDNKSVVYGNYKKEGKFFNSGPTAKFVAMWAYFFGKDLLTYNFDYMEPDYIKKFIPRKGK